MCPGWSLYPQAFARRLSVPADSDRTFFDLQALGADHTIKVELGFALHRVGRFSIASDDQASIRAGGGGPSCAVGRRAGHARSRSCYGLAMELNAQSGASRSEVNPAHIVPVTNFSGDTLWSIIAHIEVSTDFEHL